MHRHNILLAIAAAAAFASGCSQQRSDAKDALESVESSLAEIRADAKRHAPEGLKGVEANLARLNASLEAKEYGDVLAGTPQLKKAVASLGDAVDASKAQARAALAAAKTEWKSLSEQVPKMVDTIQSRVDELSQKKRLPWGVSKEEFRSAKSGLEAMKTEWAEASQQFESGQPIEAVERARPLRNLDAQIREQLKIKEA